MRVPCCATLGSSLRLERSVSVSASTACPAYGAIIMLVAAWGTLGCWKHEPADLQISAAGKKGLPCTVQAAATETQWSAFPLTGVYLLQAEGLMPVTVLLCARGLSIAVNLTCTAEYEFCKITTAWGPQAVGPVAVTSLLLGEGLPRITGLPEQEDPNNPAEPDIQRQINRAAIQARPREAS